MTRRRIHKSPRYTELLLPTFIALKKMGGSGSNDEIHDAVAKDLNLNEDILNEMHPGISSQTEFDYQLAWARTYLKKYGVISNSARSVWSIEPQYTAVETLDPREIERTVRNNNRIGGFERNDSENATTNTQTSEQSPEEAGIESDEIRPWRKHLSEVLKSMNEYAFERLSQRLLRECGFSQVIVTKKSGDGGIDGRGKLKINGILTFKVAFQCKRYSGTVGSPEIRDFRGSLTTDIEKAIFITTGTFTKAAIEEASVAGKQQIDLVNGEEFMNKLAEYGIGLREIKDYEINEEFFKKI